MAQKASLQVSHTLFLKCILVFGTDSSPSSLPCFWVCSLASLCLNFLFLFLAIPRGIWDLKFPNQGWNPGPLRWKYGVLTAGPQGKSFSFLFSCEAAGSYFSWLVSLLTLHCTDEGIGAEMHRGLLKVTWWSWEKNHFQRPRLSSVRSTTLCLHFAKFS